jgi:hypothetical protein
MQNYLTFGHKLIKSAAKKTYFLFALGKRQKTKEK